MTYGWLNEDWIFISGWTIPSGYPKVKGKKKRREKISTPGTSLWSLRKSDKSPSSKDKAFIFAEVASAVFNTTEVHKSMVFVTSHTCVYCVCVCVILAAKVTAGRKHLTYTADLRKKKNILNSKTTFNHSFLLTVLVGSSCSIESYSLLASSYLPQRDHV